MITPQDLADRLEKLLGKTLVDRIHTLKVLTTNGDAIAAEVIANGAAILASLRRPVPADTARADAIRECADIAKRHADVSAKNAAEVTNNIGRMAWTYRADESTFIQRDILALIDVVADEDGVDPSSYRYKTAVAYQIVGAIAKEFDVFEHPEVIRALDYLADHNHIDPLPWPASPLAPSRSAPASGEMGEAKERKNTMNEKQIKYMLDRFLCWKLPTNFQPDAGISFKPTFNEHLTPPMRHEPTGTNLFDAGQADAMIRHMVEGMLVDRNGIAMKALKGVWEASRAYLPPDGISKDEFISRVLTATDNVELVRALRTPSGETREEAGS